MTTLIRPPARGWTPKDLAGTEFVTGPAAWQACRFGAADPARFIVGDDFDQP